MGIVKDGRQLSKWHPFVSFATRLLDLDDLKQSGHLDSLLASGLHRLCATGSDRAAQRWKEDYLIDGADQIALHQLYRAMAWLGEVLPDDQQQGATELVSRCTKDVIEEHLFASRRDLFSALEIVFIDTTSLYFEGACVLFVSGPGIAPGITVAFARAGPSL